jgi:hypothetical protein
MQVLYRSYEGFLSSSCTYNTSLFPGKSVYLCRTERDATGIFSDTAVNLNSNDGVCYMTSNNFYTCYQRPPITNFDYTNGIIIPTRPSDDTSPDEGITSMGQVCGGSNTVNLRLNAVYQSTLSYQKGVNGVITKISDTVSQLSNVSTTYCNGITSANPNFNFCETLNTGIGHFQNLPTGERGLNSMSNTLVTMASEINTLYNGKFKPAYGGYKC